MAKGFAPRILNVWISTKNAADLYVDEVLFTKNSVLETIAGQWHIYYRLLILQVSEFFKKPQLQNTVKMSEQSIYVVGLAQKN